MRSIFLFFFISIYSIKVFSAPPISIKSLSNLTFGTLVQGDTEKTIYPGTEENGENASFRISGNKNAAFSIILPNSSTITLNGNGSYPITLSNFSSYPSGSAQLENNGKKDIYIGATIGPISPSQQPGSYSGYFTVEVIY